MEKQTYINRLNDQLAHLNKRVSELESEADRADTKSDLPSYRLLQELREKEQSVHHMLKELGEAGEESWDKLTTGVDSAWNGLEEAFESVRDRFRAATQGNHPDAGKN